MSGGGQIGPGGVRWVFSHTRFALHDAHVTQFYQEGKNRVNSFVQAHRDSSAMVFSDGVVEADGLRMGSCAAVLLPTGALSNEQVTTEVFSVLSDNIEAEVCGIALAMDVAIQHYVTASPDRESLFILSDCKTAIDLVINRYKVNRHAHVLGRVRSHLRTLCDLNVDVTLIWIHGHSDIYHDELADRSAKNSPRNRRRSPPPPPLRSQTETSR